MDKTLLKDIKRKIFIRSSLIALGSLEEILSLNDYLSPDEILLEIIEKALREFEQSNPLILEMKVNKEQLKTCYGSTGSWGEFKSNFTMFLDCLIGEDQIVLVPNSTPAWRANTGGLSFPSAGSYTYFTEYNRPYVFVGDILGLDNLIVRAICSRPIIPDFTPDKKFNPDSDRAAVYWMNIDEGARGSHFLDLCLVGLLDYIRQLKASIQLPGMSMDILGNVDSAYQELKARCDQYNLQSGWYGELII